MSQAVEEAVAGHESLDISEVEVLDISVCREAIEVKVRNICASVLEFSDSQVDVLDISACTSHESTVVTPIADATVLLEDACREGVAAGGLSARSKEDPVLSLVSLNIKTAASFDLVRGSLAVLPELPSAVAAQAKTVRVSCGRDAGNTIVLADSRVSSLHFTLRVRAAKGGYLLIHDIRGARCSSALSCGEMELEGSADLAMEEWSTAQAAYGLCYHDQNRTRKTRAQPVAGLTSQDSAYTSAANDYPRFERQMIRTIHDKDIIAGTKKPAAELLQRYPNREIPEMMTRPPSGQSMHSRRSYASGRSGASQRSAGSSIAGSVYSNPPSGYFRQLPTPNSAYQTASNVIGAGGRVRPEPQHGREVWMIGRGGGQQSSFDSCLVNKGHRMASAAG
ncbi:unnamed protein product [Polarella glacialis]|uniref:FHA domain-containing protein n=1 Tax=Polarella glacialis TaxID=89957 RepID=A0A813GP37_POLGL|nr:unnamed protein product [Polarella glacialis]